MKKNYSTIPIEEQKTTNLEENEKGSLLSGIAQENGLISSVLDEEVVDEILSTSIYNKPEVAIREVFNNALRQCRTAEKQGASPRINIIFDVKNNRLVFEEIDSMGMPVEIFKDVYIHTGRSGNLDGEESGQFGIGKKSYRAIADTMIFETYARESNEKYAFMAKGKYFEEITKPNLETFGSRVSFAIKEGVNLADLAKYVTNIAKFTQVKTYLQFTDNLKENPNHTSIAFEKGITQIGPVVPKEFLAKKLETEIENIQWIEFDKPDYYLLLAFGSHYRQERPMYNNLVGIPVSLGETEESEYERIKQNEIPDAGFAGYILNIKNERKYPPVASRDNLKQDSFEKLSQVIQIDLEDYFSKIDVRTIHDYKGCSQKYFVENLPYSNFQEVMPRSTINFNKVLGLKVETFDNEEKKDDGYYHRVELGELFKKNVQIVCNYNKTMRRINRVLEFSKDMVVLVPEGNKHDRQSSLWIMQQAGMQSISEFMKAKNIKVVRNGTLGDVAVRFGGYKINIEQMDLDDLTPNCIRIPKEQLEGSSIREFSEYLESNEFEAYGIFRDQKKFEDTDSIPLAEFLRNAQKPNFETSEGTLSAKQILKYKKIEVLRRHNSKYPEQLTIEFCKKNAKANIILIDDQTHTEEIQALMLASRILQKGQFGITGDHFDHLISEQMIAVLKIPEKKDKWDNEIDTNWKDSPENAVKYLGEIKNQTVRELYAEAYSKISGYDSTWQSEKKEDIAKYQKLHELFLSLDNSNKTQSQMCHAIYEASQKMQELDNLEDFAKEKIIAELKKLKPVQRYTQAIKLFLKDSLKNLKVVIPKTDSYRDDIIISFEYEQKIVIGEDLIELVKDVSEGYPSLKSVTVEGKRMEVLFH